MNNQDEMFERATETPAFLGCPQHMPTHLPGGFDGVGKGEDNHGLHGLHGLPDGSNPCESVESVVDEDELKKRSEVEKLNEMLFERLGEIARKCCAVRVERDPEHVDYDAAETNIKLFGAFSELRQMCDFYKPREKPVDPTAPEMNVSKQEEFNRKTWSFCDGLFPIIHVDTPDGFMARCKINGRTFRESVIKQDLGGPDGDVWIGYIYDKDDLVTSVGGLGKGKNAVKLMTHAAFMAYVKQLSGGGKKYHNRRGFLRQNAARARAAAAAKKNGGEA